LNNHRLLPSNRGKQPRFFYGYSIAAVSFIILMVVWGGQYSFGVFFKPLLNEFGWTRAATSGAYSLSMVLIGVFGIFSGRLSDRFGPRLVVTVCGLLIGIGYLLMSQISDIWQVYLFYGVLMSAGIAGTWVPLLSTVARWFVRRRGLASGIAASGIGVGTASYSWRTSYIIIGLIVLVVTTVMAQFLRREPGQMGLLPYGADSVSADSQNLGIKGFSLQEAIRGRHFWIMFVAFLLGGLGVHSAMVHIVPHATDIGFSASAAAAILSAVGIVSIGSKIGMGSIIDKIGSRRVMIVVFIVMSLSYLWLLSADDLWKLYLFAVAFGLRVHGTIFGLAMFAANTGGAVGSLVAGRIFDISSSYHWAFLLCTILGVVGLALSVLLKVARVQEPGREAAYKAGHKPQSDR